MGTQGLVTVMRGNNVILKFICGCDGYNAKKLASGLKGFVTTVYNLEHFIDLEVIETLRELALGNDFGCRECLVVMNKDVAYPEDEELSPLYRNTFDNPSFNPRWERGTVEYLEIVEL